VVSEDLVKAVRQRLLQRKRPTLAQSEALLQRIYLAELEVSLLQAALADTQAAVEAVLHTVLNLELSPQEEAPS
jgi:hypothetical protein